MVAQIIFLSTPSGWRATQKTELFFICTRFLSTPSGWRATADLQIIYRHNKFLSTPSGWRATGERERPNLLHTISIHALRVEGDWYTNRSLM